MCLAVPMQVVEMEGVFAICEGRAGRERIDTTLTGPLVAGQWVLSFLGAAREVIDAERAAQISGAINALESILASDGSQGSVDALMNTHFADLVNREPQLPEFLRPAATHNK